MSGGDCVTKTKRRIVYGGKQWTDGGEGRLAEIVSYIKTKCTYFVHCIVNQ